MILVIGLFNLLLLVPDLAAAESITQKIILIILRVVFFLILMILSLQFKKIKSFHVFSWIVTGCEILSLIIFLYVMIQSANPNLLIQTMGLITIIIVVFLIPNRLSHTLLVSILGTISFFVCATIFISFSTAMDFWAAVVYASIAILLCAICAWNTQKHQYNEFLAKLELEHMSTTDVLTRLSNRFKMGKEADKWIDYCRQNGAPLSLVFIDVDDLKSINDSFGHLVGDAVLSTLADIIQNQLRETDVISRWGGDEFLLLLPNITTENAIILSERIRGLIEYTTFEKGVSITCSFGVVEMDDASTFESLLSQSDKLMYGGKQLGKNRVQST